MSLTALVFVLAFGAGSLLAFVRHPIFGLMTYIGVFYVHPPSRWWGQGLLFDVRWSLLAAAVTLMAILVRKPAQPTAPVLRSGAFWGFVLLVVWIALQSFWALDPEAHADQLSYYLKFILVILMVCRCIETEQHLRQFLWTHVAGCFYLGWLAFTAYSGGRLDGVGGPGINEANAAALQMVTGILVAGSLFLAANWRIRAVLIFMIPIMVNGLVTTISRSGFLAAAVGGVIYNLFTPSRYRPAVRVLSVLALVLFAAVTNDIYWERIGTIKHKGEQVEGVDTGGGRLEIIAAQWRMFEGRPFGCGHMCTSVLSPSYIEERFLSQGGRASHNTFMTMLVDHGVIGAGFYILMLVWIFRSVRTLARRLKGQEGFLATFLPAIAAVFAAITIGDLFVQYPKFEARFWFVSLLIVMLHLSDRSISRGPESANARQ
jgi:hypothetical protein